MNRKLIWSMILSIFPIFTGCQSQGPTGALPTGASSVPTFASRTFSITDFGAVGDGQTMNTDAFAKTIDACNIAGGGRVIVPAGTWLTGPVHLKSNVDFHLEAGATVLFTRKLDEFPLIITNFEGKQNVECTSPLSAENCHDIAITGPGTIDGQGDAWRWVKKTKVTDEQWNTMVKSGGMVGHARDDAALTWYPSKVSRDGGPALEKLRLLPGPPKIEDYLPYRDMLRPVMVILANCHNVLLDGTTFRNSPSWNIHPLYTDNLTVRNVTIFNDYFAQNGDGLDIDSCRDVSVYDTKIDAGDDVLCFKSGRDAEGRRVGRPTENVSVTRCILGHGHGALAFGSEMSGGIRNVEISDCVINGTDDGLKFKTVRGRGNVVENIYVHDIQMNDIKNACIQADMYYMVKKPTTMPTTQSATRPGRFGRFGSRFGTRSTTMPTTLPDSVAKPLVVTQESPMPVDEGTPQVRNITVRNVSCAGANIAMIIRGLPELPVENMTFENVNITAKQGGAIMDARYITLRNVHIWSASVPVFQIQDGMDLTLENFDAVPLTLK